MKPSIAPAQLAVARKKSVSRPAHDPEADLVIPANERLADRAYRLLEEQIVTLQLAPETVWSEMMLSDRIEIGRTPVREAVQRLATDNIVQIMPRHGIMISQINVHKQLLVLETRRPLECLVATRAAQRATAEEKNRLLVLAQAMAKMGTEDDVFGFLRSYFVSKRLICEGARNPYTARALAPLHTLSRRFYFLHHQEFADLRVVAELHAEQARAVALGDERAGLKATERLLAYAQDFTKRTITNNF